MATKPTKPTISPAPSRQRPTTFAEEADAFLSDIPTVHDYMEDSINYVDEQLVDNTALIDQKIIDSENYIDNEVSSAKTYIDNEVASAESYIDNEVSSAKTYIDNEVASAESYINDQKNLAAQQVTLAEEQAGLAYSYSQNAKTSEDNAAEFEQIASSASNYVGEWDSLTGSISIPSSVYHNGVFWVLLRDLSDVTLSEPSLINEDWKSLYYELSKFIEVPSITNPVDGTSDFKGTISSSDFVSTNNFDGSHDRVHWQLSTDSTFSTIDVDEYEGSNNLTSWDPIYGNNPLTLMYARVKHGSDNHWSNWSNIISFTTPETYVETPTLSVEGEPTEVIENPILTTSAFSVFNGTDTHVSTDWEIWNSTETVLIWSSIDDTVNLTSIQVPTGYLEVATEYIFKARHKGETYLYSDYVSKSAITRDTFIDTPILSGPSSTNEWSTIDVTIDNYHADETYTVTLDTGTFVRNTYTITITFEEYASDTVATLQVYASKGGMSSYTATKTITVYDVPITGDAAVQVTDFSLVESYNSGF